MPVFTGMVISSPAEQVIIALNGFKDSYWESWVGLSNGRLILLSPFMAYMYILFQYAYISKLPTLNKKCYYWRMNRAS